MRQLDQGALYLLSSDQELENFSIYGVPSLISVADEPSARTESAQSDNFPEGMTELARL
jgi:hypothetical protein